MINTIHYDSPLGDTLIAEKDGSLIGLWIKGQKSFFGSLKEDITEKETPVLSETKQWLDCYFAGEKPAISVLKMAPIGSDFRQEVWKLLCEIPYGQVTTYGEIARKIAVLMGREQMSAQAVGGAVGHNDISIIIPCHRVVGAGGNLTGYGGGIDKKIKLLTHEGVDLSRFFVPKKGTAL